MDGNSSNAAVRLGIELLSHRFDESVIKVIAELAKANATFAAAVVGYAKLARGSRSFPMLPTPVVEEAGKPGHREATARARKQGPVPQLLKR